MRDSLRQPVRQKDGKAEADALLAFDRFRQDQTIGVQYSESDGQYSAGLQAWDRPDTSLGEMIDQLQAIQKMPDGPEKTQAMRKLDETQGASGPQRVFVGKTREKAAALTLSEETGSAICSSRSNMKSSPPRYVSSNNYSAASRSSAPTRSAT
jgi:hypothetical protein